MLPRVYRWLMRKSHPRALENAKPNKKKKMIKTHPEFYKISNTIERIISKSDEDFVCIFFKNSTSPVPQISAPSHNPPIPTVHSGAYIWFVFQDPYLGIKDSSVPSFFHDVLGICANRGGQLSFDSW